MVRLYLTNTANTRVVDVLFDRPGPVVLEHRTPGRTYALATFQVGDGRRVGSFAAEFERLRTDPALTAERKRLAAVVGAEPDQTVAFVATMDMGHDDSHEHGHGHADAGPDGIEWEDEMAEMNRMTTPANMSWQVIDPATGRLPEWRFQVGDQVKIRIVDELHSDHPMQHPFHVHGAGRFLVVERDGAGEPNLVWSDTVLVRTGETVDILLEVTNPGRWMAHCHIAEHNESGMTFSFDVVDS